MLDKVEISKKVKPNVYFIFNAQKYLHDPVIKPHSKNFLTICIFDKIHLTCKLLRSV